MRLVAFAGPSLCEADRAPADGVDWRPPAEAGDLLRLDVGPGLTVCLIDGYFDHRPAVRHKEILLVLSAGARVVGASSMGALRAAEMQPFGMEGVGVIFRAYASGRITGDDEVALVHGPPEWGWRPLSVPLVEVRATLCRALRSRLIDADEARRLLEAARAVHYVDRSWEGVLASLARDRREAVAALHVPLKQIDARAALCRSLAEPPPAATRPAAVSTSFLRALAKECGVAMPPARSGEG